MPSPTKALRYGRLARSLACHFWVSNKLHPLAPSPLSFYTLHLYRIAVSSGRAPLCSFGRCDFGARPENNHSGHRCMDLRSLCDLMEAHLYSLTKPAHEEAGQSMRIFSFKRMVSCVAVQNSCLRKAYGKPASSPACSTIKRSLARAKSPDVYIGACVHFMHDRMPSGWRATAFFSTMSQVATRSCDEF